jgi:phage-related protein
MTVTENGAVHKSHPAFGLRDGIFWFQCRSACGVWGAPYTTACSDYSLSQVNTHVNIIIMNREIILYETTSGKCPVEEFLDSLTGQQARKVAWVLELIEELSNVPTNYLKKLVNTDDIWEVRVAAGNNIFRLLGFFDGQKIIVLDHAFQKKTQKTPKRDIKTAEARKSDYFRRKAK